MDTYTHFSDTSQLERLITPERTLFELAQALDNERDAIQRIFNSVNSYDYESDEFSQVMIRTREIFIRAKIEIALARVDKRNDVKYRYSSQSINTLVYDIQDRLERLSITEAVIIGQTYLPMQQREVEISMQFFDVYTNLIHSVNALRKRLHAFPKIKDTDKLFAHDRKDSVWVISEATNQMTRLIDAFLRRNEISEVAHANNSNLTHRLAHLSELTTQTFTDLTELSQSHVLEDTELSADVLVFREFHNQTI